MSVDVIGDFLAIIRNGLIASKQSVIAPYSKLKFEITQILMNEGFIRDFEIIEIDKAKKNLKVYLKYVDGESVIHEITRVSTPGKRVYEKNDQIRKVVGNLGISILTTNKGIMTDKQAKDNSVGGEVICSIW